MKYYTVVNIKFYTLYTAVTMKYYTVVCMALLKLRKSNCHDGKKFYPTTTLIQQNWPKPDSDSHSLCNCNIPLSWTRSYIKETQGERQKVSESFAFSEKKSAT